MEQLYQHFLHILKAALQGRPLSVPADMTEWASLAELARQQRVLPLVYDAVRRDPELTGTEFLNNLRQQSRQQMILQTKKSYDFLKLMEKFRDADVHPIVVKGIICRNLYPNPDSRPSSDEDLLILPEQFARCHEILTQYGMQTALSPEQMASAYEVPYRSAASPLFIELHRSLFPPESEAYGDLNQYFTQVFEHASQEMIDGVPVSTMGYTDHLFYLICHAFKHFLHSGFGIRQVCDIILYANAHGSQIGWEELLRLCREIRGERFAAAIFRIGSAHLVFDPDRACYPAQWRQIPVNEGPLLEDLLRGGVYGSSSMSRRHSSNITLDAVAAKKQSRKSANALLLSLFPPAGKLQGRYPWLQKYPWLLPAAWADRMIRYQKESRADKRGAAAEALKIGQQRVALLKEYGILE